MKCSWWVLWMIWALPLWAQLTGPIPGIDSTSDYLVYYGTWDEDKLFRAKDFDLVILEPSHINASQVAELRAGHDGVLGTDDDVRVVGYLSIGEDPVGNRPGDGRGPCYYDWSGDSIVYTHNGYASWYVDDADHNGLPDQNGTWGSYYVNAGDTLWWDFIETQADAIFAKGLDGLFLDTIDTASPCSWGVPYCWTKEGMAALIAHLRELYPDKLLIANRGLFYFDPSLPAYYALNIRPYINGVMFENYYLEWDWATNTAHVSPWFSENRTYWAPRINNEAHQPDGFTVLALDYLSQSQPDYSALLGNQIHYTIEEQGWVDYISHIYLNVIRYDVFHHHPDGDRNPPTWVSTIGLTEVVPEGTSVLLRWNGAEDQTPPVRFNVYYADHPFTDPAQAQLLPHVPAQAGSASDWEYRVTGLSPQTTYYFLVRAEDSATPSHEDHNLRVLSAQTGGGGGGQGRIYIDGRFGDWAGVPRLDQPPQPEEFTGDAETPEADLSDLWCAWDSTHFFFSYSLAGNYTPGNYFYHLFLDTDRNSSTGYPFGSIGADYMVENNGLYRYTGTGGEWSWESISGLTFADSGNRVELGIRLDTLGVALGEAIYLVVNVNRATPPYDGLDYAPDTWETTFYTCVESIGAKEKSEGARLRPGLWVRGKTVWVVPSAYGHYRVVLYDPSGRRHRVLFRGVLEGPQRISWDTPLLPSGTYFLVLLRGDRPLASASFTVLGQ